MTGPELRKTFERFNREYFGNRLRGYRVRVVARITKLGEAGDCNRKTKTIRLQAGLPEAEMLGVLLHEMAHHISEAHGPKFAAEIARLRDMGAPLLAADIRSLEESPNGVVQRLTKEEARDLAAIAASGITLRQFATWIVREYGYVASGAELLRRYPWLRQVLADARKDRRERAKRLARFAAMRNAR